ncbi:MAG: hypothetical protein ACRD1B_10010 [Thermoanaerobaculia bacterium]
MTPREEEKREFRERASRGRVVPVARSFPQRIYTFLGWGPVARLTITGARGADGSAGLAGGSGKGGRRAGPVAPSPAAETRGSLAPLA